MKSSNRRRSNPFVCKYKVLRLYCNIHNQGWTLFKIYGHKSFVWDFAQTEEIVFPAGSVAYGGKLTEYRKDVEPHITDYAYYPKDKHLYIDRSDIAEDGFINVCINEKYRVEKINDKDYWIYDLEDVETEPDDYRFKMKIRRLEE